MYKTKIARERTDGMAKFFRIAADKPENWV